MTKSFRPWRVNEAWLLPPSVQEFVPEGHAAHLVRDIVAEELDLAAILVALHGATRLSAVPPGDDGGAAALRLQPRRLLVAADRPCLRRAARLPGGDGAEPAGLPHHQRVPPAPPRRAGRTLRAGARLVPARGPGRARPRRGGRHQAAGQRLQAQGHELRPHGPGGGRLGRRGRGLAGAGRGGGRRGGRRPWRRPARRRDAGLDARQAAPPGADPRREGGTRGRGAGRPRLPSRTRDARRTARRASAAGASRSTRLACRSPPHSATSPIRRAGS